MAVLLTSQEETRLSTGPDAGRRRPALVSSTYAKRSQFVAWTIREGYRNVELVDDAPWWNHGATRNPYGLFDVDRDGTESPSEQDYNDMDGDGYLSDDERDEDADGLTNYDESHGRMRETYWESCYTAEKPYYVGYKGTDIVDDDSDGDRIRDGADDQDHDDVPNLMELSRMDASGGLDDRENGKTCKADPLKPKPPATNHPTAYGRVNPFNPCLPARSRSCARYSNGDTGAPFDGSPDWYALQ